MYLMLTLLLMTLIVFNYRKSTGVLFRDVRSGEAGEAVQKKKKIKYIIKIKWFHTNQIFIKSFINFCHIYFFCAAYSLLLCYVFLIKTPKLFGVLLLSLRRALSIASNMRSEALSIVPHFS